MSFFTPPRGTTVYDKSSGQVLGTADGNTQYNSDVVTTTSSRTFDTPTTSTAAPQSTTSSGGNYSIDVGRLQPYVLEKSIVDALRYGIKTGTLSPQQAVNALISGASGSNADAFRITNPTSQLMTILTGGLGEVNQEGRVGIITPQGNFVPTQTTIRHSVTTGAGTSVNTQNVGSQYVKVQGAYFNNTPEGLAVVNDANTLNRLNSGQIQFQSYNSLFDIPSFTSNPIQKSAEDYAKAVYESGYALNPNIDEAAFNLLSYQDFMSQAESLVSPYYQERLQTVKSDLQLYADRTGTDLGLAEADILRKSEELGLTGRETLASRGLSFSGANQKFETDLAGETSRALEEKRTLAFRNAQDKLLKAEEQIGSSGVFPIELTTSNMESRLISPRGGITGSDVYESRANTRDLARALASDENLRRSEAYNSYIRSLSFA